MLTQGKKAEYRGSACHRCHRQKVKCSRERPCQNCTLANQPCTYAVRNRKVTVPESYLRNLEAGILDPTALATETKRSFPPSQDAGAGISCHPLDPLVESSTAEYFVSTLRQLQNAKSSTGEEHSEQPAEYEYFTLNFDTSHEKCTFKLPPYPYVTNLLEQFTIYFGHDWHWFRLGKFRSQLDNTYMSVTSAEAKDRAWLCKLLVVLALGESVNAGLGLNESTTQPSPPPGTDFFEQALRLLNIPYENASTDHIEALNLIALYSNQLNRQKTAYMYAGSSVRMCNMLQLHRASTSRGCSLVEKEHRKRLWWSTYCLDRMTSTQRGLLPTLHVDQTDLEYPSQAGLDLDDAHEFADPDYLTARIQLTIIQASISKGHSTFGHNVEHDMENIIRPTLRRLRAWRAGLPDHMALQVETSMPSPTRSLPCMRSLANLYLRYNQCLIVLLRPVLLKQVAQIYADDRWTIGPSELEELNNTCLRSARSSVRILINIQTYGLLARLGLMENMHLFTSLMIIRLSLWINTRCPGSFEENPEDANTYEGGKDVLRYMMRSGSLAAKGHLNMLKDVEDFGNGMAPNGDAAFNHEGQWDIDEWMTRLLQTGSTPTSCDI
ncbi:fungal-specific transcription factor domain-containing protein [Aspergillus varians]